MLLNKLSTTALAGHGPPGPAPAPDGDGAGLAVAAPSSGLAPMKRPTSWNSQRLAAFSTSLSSSAPGPRQRCSPVSRRRTVPRRARRARRSRPRQGPPSGARGGLVSAVFVIRGIRVHVRSMQAAAAGRTEPHRPKPHLLPAAAQGQVRRVQTGPRAPAAGPLDQSSPAQSPGIGGGFPPQFVDPCRRAWPWSRVDPPELQVRLPGLGPGIFRPLPVDDPVLEDCAYGVQPASPDEPGGPAVVPGLNVNRLAVTTFMRCRPPCAPQCSSGRAASRITSLLPAECRKAGGTIGDPG